MKSIFKRSKEEVETLLEIWGDGSQNPFLLTLEEFINLSERIKISKELINSSINPRLIVLETWLLMDFAIRHLLNTGLQLYRFTGDKYSFLPLGSKDCLKMLKDLIKDQRDKPINPARNAVILPPEFFLIINEDKDFMKKFLEFNAKYDEQAGIEYKNALVTKDDPEYRNVTETWFNYASNLTDEWFKSAKKINDVRNEAAHNLNEDEIFSELGIHGDQKLQLLKDYCNQALSQLIGIK